MKLFVLSLLLIFAACNNAVKAKYIYKLDVLGESNYIVGQNASCELSTYDKSYKTKYCYVENQLQVCETDDTPLFVFKEFNSKAVCNGEVSTKKREGIILE
jgi:hypothetical protein